MQKQFQLKLQKEQDDKEAVLKAQQVQEYLDYFANYPYQEELLVREIPDYLKTKHVSIQRKLEFGCSLHLPLHASEI